MSADGLQPGAHHSKCVHKSETNAHSCVRMSAKSIYSYMTKLLEPAAPVFHRALNDDPPSSFAKLTTPIDGKCATTNMLEPAESLFHRMQIDRICFKFRIRLITPIAAKSVTTVEILL